ncbi:MAG: PIN domain nuclease [Actinobacteria bacterium]|nr:PIN domain nuclease [Actinomycetota bacterium]
MTAEIIQILFTFLGSLLGLLIAPEIEDYLSPYPEYYSYLLVVLISTSAGFLFGYFLSKRLKEISRSIDELLSSIPGVDLMVGALGLLTGLTIAALISVPFLDAPFGKFYLLSSFIVFGFLGLFLSLVKSREIAYFILGKRYQTNKKVIDTSALIDGRILALLKNNLLEGTLIIPDIVIDELKQLADSNDILRRKRGQRGLATLSEIYERYSDRVINFETKDKNGLVDERLLEICRSEGAVLLTTDSNLAMFARVQEISAINLNELQHDLKIPVVIGEKISLKLVRKGRIKGQAVGYLDDGTMVVIENAEKLIGKEVEAVVNGVTYSHTGRVVFAEIKEVND